MNRSWQNRMRNGALLSATLLGVAWVGACTADVNIVVNPRDDGGSPPISDGTDAESPISDARPPNADAQGDASGACLAAPPSPGRGVVATLLTSDATHSYSDVAVSCGSLYIASSNGLEEGAGALSKCDLANCAATVKPLPTYNLVFPAEFSRTGKTVLVHGIASPSGWTTRGDVLRFEDDGQPMTNLGPILDGFSNYWFNLGNLAIVGENLVLTTRRQVSPHLGRPQVVMTTAPGFDTPADAVVDIYGTVGNYLGIPWLDPTTQDIHVYAFGYGSATARSANPNDPIAHAVPLSTLLVDVTSATTTTLFGGSDSYGFTSYGFIYKTPKAIVVNSNSDGSIEQFSCESPTTCATPTRITNAALPTSGVNFFGALHDELLWQDTTTGDIRSCPLSTWATAACVPETIAAGAPMAASPILEVGDVSPSDASTGALYYVDTNGNVISVGL